VYSRGKRSLGSGLEGCDADLQLGIMRHLWSGQCKRLLQGIQGCHRLTQRFLGQPGIEIGGR
jgi:hypothetical protein